MEIQDAPSNLSSREAHNLLGILLCVSLHVGTEADSSEVSRIQGVGELGQQKYGSSSEQKTMGRCYKQGAYVTNTQMKQICTTRYVGVQTTVAF